MNEFDSSLNSKYSTLAAGKINGMICYEILFKYHWTLSSLVDSYLYLDGMNTKSANVDRKSVIKI